MHTLPLDEAQLPVIAECIHCGTRFKPTTARSSFCCSGCEFVHRLIRDEGLEKFYDLRDGKNAPVTPLVFQKRDYAWLAALAAVFDTQETGELRLELQGISCIGCVWLVENLFLRKPGALAIEVNPALGELHLKWKPGVCDLLGFAREIQQFGYVLGPLRTGANERRVSGFVKRLGVCGAFAMNAMLFSIPRYLGMDEHFALYAWFDRLAFAFATLSFLVGGSYFIRRAFQGLMHRVCQIDTPIALGLIAAYAGSLYAWSQNQMSFAYFDFIATFTFLMLVGRWTQQAALERNRNRLLRSDPAVPTIELNGKTNNALELQPGICYTIHPGQFVPVRSKLLSRETVLGLEWINGESEPRIAKTGQLIPAGAMHRSPHPLELEALEPWRESLLASLMAVSQRPAAHDLASQGFIAKYIGAVIATAIAGSLVWVLTGAPFLAALQVFISVLVVSCPCASGVALPFLDELALSALRSAGIFVRERSLWARLLKVRKIIFDKTGTLTFETMALKNPEALDALGASEKERLLWMVSESFHPVASCLREYLMTAGVPHARASLEKNFRSEVTFESRYRSAGAPAEVVGHGIEWAENGQVWRLGRPGWSGPEHAASECVFSCNGAELASFQFVEQLRAGAKEEIAALRTLDYKVYIASGDRSDKVAAMADLLELPRQNIQGELTPSGKAEWIRSQGAQDALMVGDGANDSLAFNESLCTGTPAIDRGLLEKKSDFYFLGRGLQAIRQLIETAHQRKQGIRTVLGFTIGYNVIAVAAALSGWMSPVVAAVAMPLSSLVSLALAVAVARRFQLRL